jgi:ferredoxin
MAVREIIHIDESKCDGCGDCVTACAEGAIQIIDGKARLISDTYCDGLGACLGHCPQGAITIEKREAPDYDEIAVENHLAKMNGTARAHAPHGPACPGSQVRQMQPRQAAASQSSAEMPPSCLGQWPVQLGLIPPHAPFLANADLVVCADCVPFAIPDFHTRYLDGRIVLVGCPKLDDLQAYYEKFRQMFAINRPKRITVLRMEVPCCGGIAQATMMARNECAPDVPLEIHTIGINSSVKVDTVPAAENTKAS